MGIHTDRTAHQYVLTALDGRDAQYDVDAIVRDAYEANDENWNFDLLTSDLFWIIVSRHAKVAPINPTILMLTQDHMQLIVAGLQEVLYQMGVPEILSDEMVIPLLTDMVDIAKRGGTITVTPF